MDKHLFTTLFWSIFIGLTWPVWAYLFVLITVELARLLGTI